MCFGDFNSRLYCKYAGEENIIGSYYVKNQEKTMTASMNRFLLIEFCSSTSTCIGNTFLDHPIENRITYRALGTQAHDVISPTNFAQLDLVLIEEKWWDTVIDIQSCTTLPLASQHFLLWCLLDVRIEKITKQSTPVRRNAEVLQNRIEQKTLRFPQRFGREI